MSSESSGLHALAALRALESDRLAQDQARRAEAERAQALAQEAAAQAAAAAEQRAAWERQQAWQRAAELQQAAELAERQRLAVVAEQARLEQQHRLRLEEQRLEARMRDAERAARPMWPYAVVPALVAAIGLAGAIAWHGSTQADLVAAAGDAQRTTYDQQMAVVQERLDSLAAKQQRLEAERDELAQRLTEATTAAERTAIEAQIAAVDDELAATAPTTTPKATPRPRPTTGRKPTATKPPKPAGDDDRTEPKPSGRKPIVVGDGSDPLDGLD